MKLALIIPLKNEAAYIGSLLNQILLQTMIPDEIIVVDGGSTDQTRNIVTEYHKRNPLIRLIAVERSLPGRGRNIGAEATNCDILIFCDAGCSPEPRWIEEMIKPFKTKESTDVVYGNLMPLPKTLVAKAITIATFSTKLWPYVTCMALRKTIWSKVGGFPENLRITEDYVFIKAIDDLKCKISQNPLAVNYWETRSACQPFFKQYYSYAKGSGIINVEIIFHIRKTLFYIIILLLIIIGIKFHHNISLVVAMFLTVFWMIVTIKEHYIWFKSFAKDVRVVLLLPLIIFIRDIATILGYIDGQITRIVNYPK